MAGIKVKYQGDSFGKKGNCRDISVSQTHLVMVEIKVDVIGKRLLWKLNLCFSVPIVCLA